MRNRTALGVIAFGLVGFFGCSSDPNSGYVPPPDVINGVGGAAPAVGAGGGAARPLTTGGAAATKTGTVAVGGAVGVGTLNRGGATGLVTAPAVVGGASPILGLGGAGSVDPTKPAVGGATSVKPTTGTGGKAGTGGAATATGGKPSTGTGGAATATGGKSSTGTGGAATSGTRKSLNGYHESGAWKGYAFTGVDKAGTASITPTPASFETMTTDGPYCVKGKVPVTSDWSALAMVGFNVNETHTLTPVVSNWTPTVGGLKVNVTNNSSMSEIRVQIQGPNGATDENDRWCAPLTEFGKDVVISWGAFNTKCWDNSGDYYAMTPLTTALVFVPGMSTKDKNPVDRAFDYCVNAIGPVDTIPNTGTGTTGPCQNPAAGVTGTLGSQMFLPVSGRNAYVVQNNVWKGDQSRQTISYNGTSFAVTAQDNPNPGDGSPASYPSIFIGSNWGRTTEGSNLPAAISSITSVPTCLAWSKDSSTSGDYNIAYDVWFDKPGQSNGQVPSGGYLMVWLHKPTGAQPAGKIILSSLRLAGQDWVVWSGNNHQGVNVISYVHAGDLASLSFDLKTFIDDATTRNAENGGKAIESTWVLTNVFGGAEIWSGGKGIKIDGFTAEVKK